jgi:hypothetical protein
MASGETSKQDSDDYFLYTGKVAVASGDSRSKDQPDIDHF